MAVVTRYVVVRNDKEEGVFATQQEADAHDAMLERAEKLSELLEASTEQHGLQQAQIDLIARLLADKTEEMAAIFAAVKTGKRASAPRTAKQDSPRNSAPTGNGDEESSPSESFPKAVGQN